MMPKGLLIALLLGTAGATVFGETPSVKPSHDRPYFMPESKRKEILQLIRTEPWAKERYEALKSKADGPRGDGFAAAFLYALEGDPAHGATAEKWLVSIRGKPSHHRQRLEDPDFWKGGQTMQMSEIHYGTNPNHYVAFDWAYRGLSDDARKAVYQGLLDETRYRMKWLDTWRYTPNLEFKPLYMAAFGGLTLQDADALRFLYGRVERHGSYFSMIDRMLLDGQAWHEAPIYPVCHTDLWCMATMFFYGQLATGQDWFSLRGPSGATAKGLMDYYIDTAYPMETHAAGSRRIRVVTYGDGATNTKGDLFLVNTAVPEEKAERSSWEGGLLVHQALIGCYRASGRDPAYAKFVSMIPGYEPDLWDRPPLPDRETLAFPPAPSKLWPDFGLAMLRSIESPDYWTDPKAIAVFQLMTKGYGHDHADKFSIMLHGAGKLLYPDFNAIQYENPSIGWTRNTVAHSTMMVDEEDTSAAPCAIRHEFTPEVKFLATSTEGVFDGVAQTRALLLTDGYLLDLFAASSKYPRVYDYLLHSMGKPQPVTGGFGPGVTASRRFWALEDQRGLATDRPWQLDFAAHDEAAGSNEPASMVRVTMAGQSNTAAVCGTWGKRFGEVTNRKMAELGMLVVRRADRRATIFAAAHEPYYEGERPAVSAVSVVAQSADAVVIRVEGADFTDYAAVEWKTRELGEPSVLGADDGQFGFRNYAWLRITTDGTAVSHGQWVYLRVPTRAVKTLNGRPARIEKGKLVIGDPLHIVASPDGPRREQSAFRLEPPLMRIKSAGTARLSITNESGQTVSGSVELDLPAGLSLQGEVDFGPVAPGASTDVDISLQADANSPRGMKRVPYRLRYTSGDDRQARTTLYEALPVTVGSTLVFDYGSAAEPRFRILAPGYTAESIMRQGLLVKLAGPDGTVVLDDQPLFTFSNKDKRLLYRGQQYGFTWPQEAPASITAHVEDRVRYRTAFLNDRVRVSSDRTWTLVEDVRFSLPGAYTAPKGKPAWKRIVAIGPGGEEIDARPGRTVKVAAAELALPGLPYNLAFEFNPPLTVDFDGPAMQFTFDGFSNDWWSFGFCPPGELAEWRNAGGK